MRVSGVVIFSKRLQSFRAPSSNDANSSRRSPWRTNNRDQVVAFGSISASLNHQAGPVSNTSSNPSVNPKPSPPPFSRAAIIRCSGMFTPASRQSCLPFSVDGRQHRRLVVICAFPSLVLYPQGRRSDTSHSHTFFSPAQTAPLDLLDLHFYEVRGCVTAAYRRLRLGRRTARVAGATRICARRLRALARGTRHLPPVTGPPRRRPFPIHPGVPTVTRPLLDHYTLPHPT